MQFPDSGQETQGGTSQPEYQEQGRPPLVPQWIRFLAWQLIYVTLTWRVWTGPSENAVLSVVWWVSTALNIVLLIVVVRNRAAASVGRK